MFIQSIVPLNHSIPQAAGHSVSSSYYCYPYQIPKT
jgi:hypothetical protein